MILRFRFWFSTKHKQGWGQTNATPAPPQCLALSHKNAPHPQRYLTLMYTWVRGEANGLTPLKHVLAPAWWRGGSECRERSVCVYVYIYMYIYIYIYIYVYVYIHYIYIYTYIHIYIYVIYIDTYIYTYIYLYVWRILNRWSAPSGWVGCRRRRPRRAFAPLHIYVYMCIYICIYIYVSVYMCICVYIKCMLNRWRAPSGWVRRRRRRPRRACAPLPRLSPRPLEWGSGTPCRSRCGSSGAPSIVAGIL